MPRKKLTKSNIDSIKFSDQGQVIYWDTDTPGLGLVVGARTKTFRLQMDVRDTTKPKGYRTVNGQTLNSVMPPQEAVLTDAQIADVLTFVYNTWGNRGEAFSTAQVKAIRGAIH